MLTDHIGPTLADQEFEIETYTAHDIGAEI
jgi:hypothetical protein